MTSTHIIETDSDIFQVFTDGSCADNKGSYACVYVGGPLKGYADTDIIQNATNIRAEGIAIIVALENAAEADGWSRLQIYTDSKFWKDMLEKYMPKWTDEKFARMRNPDLTTKLWSLWSAIQKPKEIRFVPAHNKTGWKNSADPYKVWCHQHNDRADRLAAEVRKN